MKPKYKQQNNQYTFPYHWIPEWDNKLVKAGRRLSWALEYCSYMKQVKTYIISKMPSRVLDVGCGDGRLADFLRDVPEINYVGLDTSKKAIVMANAMNPDGKYICGNVSDINEKFTCITCVEVLEHIPDEEISEFLSDISSKLDQGGELIISVPTDVRPTHKKHYRHYSRKLLAQQLRGAGLSILDCTYIYKECTYSKIISGMISNRFFTLNHGSLLKTLYWAHSKFTYYACPDNGAHLVCLCKTEDN